MINFQFIFLFLISFSILLTNSRSAWLSFFISIFLIIGIKSLKTIRDILFSISIILGLYFVPFLGSGIQNLIGKINPELILLKFTDFKYFRFTIWKESIESILRNPIFGTELALSQIFSFLKLVFIETILIICLWS